MAGAITHMLASEAAAADLGAGVSDLPAILGDDRARPFLFLGSVSPDLPYLGGFLVGERKWADRMHYTSTNLVPCGAAVVPGVEGFAAMEPGRAFLAWLAGYVSHCVVDATVHPVVQMVVGPYQTNALRHRQCEMYQDALLFRALKGRDLRDSGFVHVLKRCENQQACASVADNWSASLVWAYKARKAPATVEWLYWYRQAVNAASDADLIALLSRPLRARDTLVYETAKELRRNDTLCKEYFDDVVLPPAKQARGDFVGHVFRKAVDNVREAWGAMWSDVSRAADLHGDWKQGTLHTVVRNWDLDTGIDIDAYDNGVTYWPA
jgi:Zinc dependent phospholipase C